MWNPFWIQVSFKPIWTLSELVIYPDVGKMTIWEHLLTQSGMPIAEQTAISTVHYSLYDLRKTTSANLRLKIEIS